MSVVFSAYFGCYKEEKTYYSNIVNALPEPYLQVMIIRDQLA